MELNFKIKGDMLAADTKIKVVAGNVNSYICKFDILTDRDLIWFCVFKKEKEAIQQSILDGECIFPAEMLINSGTVMLGCYATKAGEDFVRISTNLIELTVDEGSYTEATVPEVPTPDAWEQLALKTVPQVGENGNWFIYDLYKGDYIDSGISAYGMQGEKGDIGEKGEKGDTGYSPQKGIDYWTEEDKEDICSEIDSTLVWSLITEISENQLLLADRLEARLGEISKLTLALPTSIPARYESILIFRTGDTEPQLEYSSAPIIWRGDDCDKDGLFIPAKNSSYEVAIRSVGVNVDENGIEQPVIVARVGAY